MSYQIAIRHMRGWKRVDRTVYATKQEAREVCRVLNLTQQGSFRLFDIDHWPGTQLRTTGIIITETHDDQ